MVQAEPIAVAAGIVVRDGKILICQRHRSDPYGMQWEFPGGKVREGESLPQALRRELGEELGIDAVIGEEVLRLRHHYPDRYVEVAFFRVPDFEGAVANRVFERVEWATRGELSAYNFLEADRDLVGRIARGEII